MSSTVLEELPLVELAKRFSRLLAPKTLESLHEILDEVIDSEDYRPLQKMFLVHNAIQYFSNSKIIEAYGKIHSPIADKLAIEMQANQGTTFAENLALMVQSVTTGKVGEEE